MYRVLIVDDESYVVDWISNLLEEQIDPDYDICRAYSAAEALGWLNRAKIDILITDIRMPKMSGMELAEKVRMNWPQCKILMLTAYAEFNYAYEAIRNDIVSYILKDESDEYILAEVKKAATLLDNELSNRRLLENMRERLDESASAVQNELLLELIQNDHADRGRLFSQLERIGTELNPDAPFLLFGGKLEYSGPEPDAVGWFKQLTSVKSIVAHFMNGHFRCFAAESGRNSLVWLIQPCAEEAESPAAVAVSGALETVQRSCMETLGLNVSFVLHGELLAASQLPDAMRSLNDMFAEQPEEQSAFIITTRAKLAPSAETPEPDMAEAKRLAEYLSAGRFASFQEILESICGRLEHCVSWHDNAALELYYATAVTFASYINQRKLTPQIALKIDLSGLFRPYDAGSWKNAADYLRHFANAITDIRQKSGGQLSENIIRALEDYIDGHITGDVSLVRLSEVTGYNATYLSHLFRECTGITLKDYISREKLLKIEELMADAKLNINHIAAGAGFESRTYFNNFLQRMVGMSPQAYRLHLHQTQKK